VTIKRKRARTMMMMMNQYDPWLVVVERPCGVHRLQMTVTTTTVMTTTTNPYNTNSVEEESHSWECSNVVEENNCGHLLLHRKMTTIVTRTLKRRRLLPWW
jgi:hypothetical protein